VTDREIIALCARAGVRWEGPDMCDFMGQFEATSMEGMRAIIAQARAEWEAELHAYADRQYCIGIEKMLRPECLGWEQKVKVGKFGEAEMKAHEDANKAFGAHFGIYAAIRAIPNTKEGHEDQ
jgi:hypothetical protein